MIRLAIVGAGVIAGIHARALQGFPDARVTWVADAEIGRAEALAAGFGARATTDNEAATGATDVDAVLVTVPTPYHRGVVELAAAHGKHVFCEKPIARTVADAEAIIAACNRAGVRLMTGQVVRFFPECARAKQVVVDGVLGTIGVVRASRVGGSPVGTRPWMADPAAGGGVVVDLMIHELDTLRWYFGDIARAYALDTNPMANGSGVDYAQALLRFECGVVAHVEASWAHVGFRTRLEIAGEHGILAYDSDESSPLRADLQAGNGASARVERWPASTERPYVAQLWHFFDRLRDGAPFLADGEQGLRALEAAIAVLASARTGRPVHFAHGRPRLEEIAA